MHLPAEKARLADHAYTFAGYDEHYKGGTSRLLALPGAHVLGVAYSIDSAQLENRFEAAGHGYTLREHRIELSGESVIATTLKAPEERPLQPTGERLRRARSLRAVPALQPRGRGPVPPASRRPCDQSASGPSPGGGLGSVRSIGDLRLSSDVSLGHDEMKTFGAGWVVLQPGDATPAESHDERRASCSSREPAVSLDRMPFAVQKGDAVYIEPFTTHSVRNDGDEALEFICLWWNEVEPSSAEVTSTAMLRLGDDDHLSRNG